MLKTILKSSVPILFFLNLNAQVNDIWIQTPPLGMVMPFPTPYYKASLELDVSEGQFISNRPLLRISGIETSGGSRNVKLFMNSSGNLGLGSANPTSLLQLNKNTTKQGVLTLSYKNTAGVQNNSSELGISTTNNSYWMGGAYAIGGTNSMFNPGYNTASKIEFSSEGIEFFSVAKQGSNVINANAWKKGMTVDKAGKVRIGEESVYGTHSDFKLAVDGKIVTKKIIVTNGSECADYVFAADYKLMPLAELKLYIDQNNHLPNVPSASEVAENGVDVFEMNKILLEKVEELTLHLIKMEERIKEIEEKE